MLEESAFCLQCTYLHRVTNWQQNIRCWAATELGIGFTNAVFVRRRRHSTTSIGCSRGCLPLLPPTGPTASTQLQVGDRVRMHRGLSFLSHAALQHMKVAVNPGASPVRNDGQYLLIPRQYYHNRTSEPTLHYCEQFKQLTKHLQIEQGMESRCLRPVRFYLA
jgi:hypothetical protein